MFTSVFDRCPHLLTKMSTPDWADVQTNMDICPHLNGLMSTSTWTDIHSSWDRSPHPDGQLESSVGSGSCFLFLILMVFVLTLWTKEEHAKQRLPSGWTQSSSESRCLSWKNSFCGPSPTDCWANCSRSTGQQDCDRQEVGQSLLVTASLSCLRLGATIPTPRWTLLTRGGRRNRTKTEGTLLVVKVHPVSTVTGSVTRVRAGHHVV